MEPVNIVLAVGMPLPENVIEALESVDPRVHVTLLTQEQRTHLSPEGAHDPAPAARELARLLADAEVVFTAVTPAPAHLKQRAPKLRWFQTTAAGVDAHIRAGYLDWDIIFTSGSGPAAVPIGEFVLMTMLMQAKNAPMYVRRQDRALWQRAPGHELRGKRELRGKTVGVVGLGEIGREVAGLVKAFGCRVIGIRRAATEARENAQGVDLLLPARDLPRLLAESDFVVIAAPATPETNALIGAEALRQMKPSAYLINIARGSLIDEPALIAALQSGAIAGAALDVFASEPLPPESELWQLERALVTPHVSFLTESWLPGQFALLTENLRRYLRGEPMINVVSKELGY